LARRQPRFDVRLIVQSDQLEERHMLAGCDPVKFEISAC
jgi:hypothetical protein